MNPIDILPKLLENPHISAESKQEIEALIHFWEMESFRKDFIIEKLSEDKKITENFLNKTVEDLEEKNKELYRTVKERQAANEKLIEINKELEQFAYIISHDLQEPLRTILNFSDLLVRRKLDQLDEKARIYLDFISQSTQRMSNLIKAILDYSRIGKTDSKSKIDCNRLIKDVLLDLSTIIEEKKAIICKVDMPQVLGYKSELRSLFQNLLSNALKYSKSQVTPQVFINCKETGNYWQFSVEDNGIGFKSEYKDRIFVIFQRLNNSAELSGSGIGLSQCKKIVELHNGKIWAESVPNLGSIFYFTLPKKN